MTESVGKNIKKKLIDLDKSAKSLAEYAGVSEAYISKLCNSDRGFGKVSAETAIKIAEFLGCSVYELISSPKEMEEE